MTEEIQKKFYDLKNKETVRVLSFESSCDETSVAVVENGRKILSNIISTQIPIHERFGGVVPEVASRNHITAISALTKKALQDAGLTYSDIDAIAVTYGAGLIGALLVGVTFAKALAYALELPLVAVSHIEGHIAANYLTHPSLVPPFTCLMVSGGHSAIFSVEEYVSHTLIGTTIDDAVGEAFDKVARVLGLGYPGGPKIDALSKDGEPNIVFKSSSSLKNSSNFSFSGIKTAVINYLNSEKQAGREVDRADVAASFQKLVTDELSEKAIFATKKTKEKTLVCAGGVSANSHLHEVISEKARKENIKVFFPELKLCTDNAAMVGSAAYYMIRKGEGLADLDLTAVANIDLR